MDKKNRALLTGTITYAIGSFGTKILSFLIVPLYTYFIKPADLGDYDLLLTTVSLLSPLLTMKISDAAYRWIIKDRENEKPYISATYTLLIKNCLFFSAVLILINHFVSVKYCGYFIAILIGDRVLECLQKLLRGLKNQKLFAASGLFHAGLMVVLGVTRICIRHENVTALLQNSIISLYTTGVLILAVEKRLRIKPAGHCRDRQKEMLVYSTPLVPSALSWWVMSASDRYVIKGILGSAANGIYSVAYKFPSILQICFQMFNNAWTDMALAELRKNDQSGEYTDRIFRKLYKTSFGMAFVLIPFTKLFMNLILGNAYKEAAIYTGFLYLGTVFQGFSAFCSIGYLQCKRTKGAARTSIYGATVNLLVDILLMKYIGLFAASLSTFLGFFAMWITRMNDIKKDFPIKVDIREFAIYLLAGITLATLTCFTNNVTDFMLVCIGGIVCLINNMKEIKKIMGKNLLIADNKR